MRARLGAAALAAAGVLFLLYPAVRPWTDESTERGARTAMASGAWVASHLFAMIGFILVPLGVLAIAATLRRPPALAAAVTMWIGAGLTLPYYGAEDFGLHAIAGQPGELLPAVDAVRFGAVAATTFGIGLLALGVGAVLAAVAVVRSGALSRSAAIAFALGFALYLPQFFTPAPARIAHGVLVAAGCLGLAWGLWRAPHTTAPAG
ncbi:hypothetical protein [Rhizomonospora bruguierae]|uniref:hypothetical protein n=1 Tax=Rhizomonospora bruguierae TaxID=1581705 RepID=UPI001BCF15B9|nr:hypothetical protein [Micromonospora sp. NBRC 107566]